MSGDYGQATSPSDAHPSAPLPDAELPKVSAQMVAAGVRVLWSSGVVEGQLDSDELLVADIYRAMARQA